MSLARHCDGREPEAVGVTGRIMKERAGLAQRWRGCKVLDFVPAAAVATATAARHAAGVNLEMMRGPQRGDAGQTILANRSAEEPVIDTVERVRAAEARHVQRVAGGWNGQVDVAAQGRRAAGVRHTA